MFGSVNIINVQDLPGATGGCTQTPQPAVSNTRPVFFSAILMVCFVVSSLLVYKLSFVLGSHGDTFSVYRKIYVFELQYFKQIREIGFSGYPTGE